MTLSGPTPTLLLVPSAGASMRMTSALGVETDYFQFYAGKQEEIHQVFEKATGIA